MNKASGGELIHWTSYDIKAAVLAVIKLLLFSNAIKRMEHVENTEITNEYF